MSDDGQPVDLWADVLVIGGGPAGCWAALTALENGASVVLAEKGYTGTAGPTAAGNSTMIDARPGSEKRARVLAARVARGMGLVEEGFVDTVLDETHAGLDRLQDWGYRFPRTDDGSPYRGSMRGVDYLRFMRQRLIKGGAVLLDQSPALTLLTHDGAVAGAQGVARVGGAPWTVRAGAVVIATGGCAFLSGALGTNNNTGDGYLMAAELGVRFSGMEFTGQYGIAPVDTSVTKGVIYAWASFFDGADDPLPAKGDRAEIVASVLKDGGRVYALLDKAGPEVRAGMRGQANIFLPFDRQGIDPFTEKFEITMLYEGTVRGTGGIAVNADTSTEVPGLFAVGDAASRLSVSGATSGGGGPNASWAMASGTWAGRNAARFAAGLGAHAAARPVRSAAPDPVQTRPRADDLTLRRAIQAEILPLDRSFHRTGESLVRSARTLNALWSEAVAGDADAGPIKSRETLAMAATARWMLASALERRETRGIHRRNDLPQADPALAVPIVSGGLDAPWATQAPPLRVKVPA